MCALVELCREMGLLATASVAIDAASSRPMNNRDKNFTRAKVERGVPAGGERRALSEPT